MDSSIAAVCVEVQVLVPRASWHIGGKNVAQKKPGCVGTPVSPRRRASEKEDSDATFAENYRAAVQQKKCDVQIMMLTRYAEIRC